jgi:hypothetical protein
MQHQSLWSRGRGNHYLFDLNRDWLVHLQPEVRDLAGEVLGWNPHLLVDSHEQSGLDTYLFDPPREPINVNLSPKVMEWRERFSADQAAAFNRYGWSYYTKDWYSEWSPIYTNAWASVQGAIGLLYEQARVNAASVKQATGEEISYRQAVHHHIVSTLANLETLRANRRQILRDFVTDRRWAIEEEAGGRTFLLPPCADSSRWNRFVELLQSQAIEVKFALETFEAGDLSDIWGKRLASRKFQAGTLVVRLGQPRRRMLQTLCQFDPHLTDSFLVKERKELENHRDTLLYDVTAWNLPTAFGLESYWAESVSDVRLGTERSETPAGSPKLSRKKSGYGYLIDFADSSVYSILVRLFEERCHPRIAVKPLKIEGHKYKPGAILLRGHENPDDMWDMLRKIETDFDAGIRAVDSALVEDGPDLGSNKYELLTVPKVAIASQWPVYSTSFGSVWYLLDHQLRLRCSPINIQNIGRIDLRKYNVLISPDGGDLGTVFDKKVVEKLKKWIESGGTLVALGSSASFVAGRDRGLSSVRLKRDVLDRLAEYDEAVEREKSARRIDIDPAKIWGTGPSGKRTEPEDGKDEVKKPDVEKLKRSDEWNRIFSPTGAFLTGVINTEHWLGFGLDEKLPVMFRGSRALMSKHPVRTPVRLADEDELRLSGLLWPEARDRIAQTAYATVESVGRGQIILFATDPAYRMWLPGAQRLLLNAVLLGPGMGTSQPVPW